MAARLKVATLTLDGYFNYGNVLQRYALCHVLENMGIEVESLWYTLEKDIEPRLKSIYEWMQPSWSWKLPIKLLLNWKGIRHQLLSGVNAWEAARDTGIKRFVDNYIPMRYNVDFSTVAQEYDYFITGSDQVWNPYFAQLDKTFLTFAAPEQRMAYGASIAVENIPDNVKAEFSEGLSGMAAISVREDAGAELIQSICGRKAQVVLDPTMLLSVEEWSSLARRPNWMSEEPKYLVTYFLGKRPDDIICQIARENGLQVINMMDENNFNHSTVTPEEWLWLIRHAEFVYTDSYHGAVFSSLFQRPFVVTDRIGSNVAEAMTSRIDTLLSRFGLTSQRGTKENGYMPSHAMNVDFGMVEKVLEQGRHEAEEYLCQAMGLNR